MANEVIQIGNKIEMYAAPNPAMSVRSAETPVYVSQFLQWSDVNVAAISIPSYKGALVPLRVDDVYELHFFTKGGLYRCRGRIVKRMKTLNNLAVAEIRFISALEKYQRRQYYRMDCIMPMNYAVLTDVQRELYKEKKRCIYMIKKFHMDLLLK